MHSFASQVVKIVELSTEHLTTDDLDILIDQAAGESSHWIRIPVVETANRKYEFVTTFLEIGFSYAYCRIVEMAVEAGCKYVHFSPLVKPTPTLPRFPSNKEVAK